MNVNNEPTNFEYDFKREDEEYDYSCKLIVTKRKKPESKNKIVELSDMIQDLENEKLNPLELLKSDKVKRISDLVKELAPEYGYRFERTVGPDYNVYTRRIGDLCDVLIDYEGKVAYTKLDLRKPFKHHYYENVFKILPQKREVKRFGKAFWAVEENFFLGTLGQRGLSYLALTGLAGITGIAYGFGGPGSFLTSVLYGIASSFFALGCTCADYYRYKNKTKNIFKTYTSRIVYNKAALEKAFDFKPSKSFAQSFISVA